MTGTPPAGPTGGSPHGPTGSTTAWARSQGERARGPWALKDLLVLAVLGAVFGFLYWALVQAWGALQVLMGPFGDLAQNALMGGWIVVAPLAVFIVRRPGAGVVAEIAAAFVEFAFLGSPVGPMLLLAAFVQGAGAEVAFALTRYRRYGWGTFLASGVTGVTANFVYAATMFSWWTQDLLALRIGLQLAGGLLLCGVLGKLLADALLRTGVLDGFAPGRDAARLEARARATAGRPGATRVDDDAPVGPGGDVRARG